MAKIEEKNDREFSRNYRSPQKDRLSTQELYELDKELLGFFTEKKSSFFKGTTLKMFDEMSWLKSKGVVNKHGAVIVTDYVPAIYNELGRLVAPQDCKPILFEQLQADLEQWRKWKSRKEYAQYKQREETEEMYKGLDSIAESMAN